MKKIFLFLLAVAIIPMALDAAPLKKEIDENWTFRQRRGNNWYPATVPGVVHTDLMDNKIIEDPFYRLNERGVQWVDKEDWIYKTTFDVSTEIFTKNNITITFQGLDTYADVILNGDTILSADNMFRSWKADIKRILKPSGNELQVYIHSPIKIGMPLWESVPWRLESGNDQSANGGLIDRQIGIWTRKAGYHYGWDWGPRLVTQGIWRPVVIEAWDDVRIEDVFYKQASVTAKQATIDVTARLEVDRNIHGATVVLTNKTDGKVVFSKRSDLNKGTNFHAFAFTMKNPKLWWSNGLGDAFLYDFELTVTDSNGAVIDSRQQKLGIRSIRLVTDPDQYGEGFYFELNGVPVFAKGANTIPLDNFLPRITAADYDKMVLDAVAANMNMLRVWGGGIYEHEAFYEACDKYGIMVWQDFMFACALYPAEGEFMENIRQEAIENVIRLRNHASLALWCGNNECLDMWFNWGVKRRYDRQNPEWSEILWKQFTDLYNVVLPEVVAEHHPGIDYRKSSPFSNDMGTRDHTVGDMHYWEVWQGRQPLSQFAREKSRFFSEYGFQSFPEFSSVKRFAPEQRDWEVTSEVMMSHQRGGSIANTRINNFLLEEYGTPSDFPNFTYMSQLLQADAIKTAMDFHRRDMHYCMGSLVWQHNDCWPVASWSSRDWYGRWKAQHYFTVRSFDDVLISPVEEDGLFKVYAVSDRLKATSGKLTVTVYNVDGTTVGRHSASVKVASNASNVVWTMNLATLLAGTPADRAVVNVEYTDKAGRSYSDNFYGAKHIEMQYAKPDVKTSLRPVDGGFELTLSSNKFVRAAFVSFDGQERFISDNFMDLLPDRDVTVKVTTDMPLAQVRGLLKVTSLADARK